MKLPLLVILVSLCLAAVSLSGCTAPSTKTYYSNEILTISIASNYTGNYSAWIPTLFVNDTTVLPPIWTDLRLKTSAPLFSEIRVTDKGSMQYLESRGNITLVGHHNLTEGKCCSATEDYTHNQWAPRVPGSPLGSLLPSMALLDPPNNSTTAFLHLDIKYSGKSNYCSRNDHIHGDIHLNGTWSNLLGEDLGAVCS